jgi:membrane protein implicated in regulation of membrane protease activity
MDWWMWVIAAVLLAAGEVHTQAFYAIFLAIGALAAAVVSLVGLPLLAQAIIGGLAALAGVMLLRPVFKRLQDERRTAPYRFPGMVNGLVGQRAVTVDAVGDEHHPGHALLANERWLAVTDPGEALPSQTEVVVAAVRGTTLLVRASGAPHLT